MKVKRFFAPTMSAALKQVREAMGADAVILSSQRTADGVEIVTALDYDENMARERLPTSAQTEVSSGRLARMQAEQHRQLETELSRTREKLTAMRQRSAERPAAITERAKSISGNNTPALHADDDFTVALSSPLAKGEKDDLADMREEIRSLRELISGQVQAPATKAVSGTEPGQQRLTERLEEFGLARDTAQSLARTHAHGRLDEAWKQSLKTLAAGVKGEAEPWLDKGGVYALVGPTGSGKTTTIGKMAAQYVLRHGHQSLALVTTDRYRIAAHEQLFVFGRILSVPVRVVDDTHSLDSILDELSDRHLVLIDTAGLTQADLGHEQQLKELADSRHDIQPHLVVAATSQSRVMKSVWHCFKSAGLKGCVLTKLDEALTLGEALGFAFESALPVAWYTDGQKVPEDLHSAEGTSLVRLGLERMRRLGEAQKVAAGAS